MVTGSPNGRPWTFYALAAFFTLFVLFLYGPMSAIFILSFQGPNGGLTFPMNGVSFHWFAALVAQQRSGDFVGSFGRSITLAALVLVITVVISIMAGLAFRYRFRGATAVFYMAIASLIMPGLLLGLGVGLMFQFAHVSPAWFSDRKSTRLNSSHSQISYAVFCLKKKIAPRGCSSRFPQISSLPTAFNAPSASQLLSTVLVCPSHCRYCPSPDVTAVHPSGTASLP